MRDFIRNVVLIVLYAVAAPIIWLLDRTRWKK